MMKLIWVLLFFLPLPILHEDTILLSLCPFGRARKPLVTLFFLLFFFSFLPYLFPSLCPSLYSSFLLSFFILCSLINMNTEAPNEAHILTILRNLTLVPQNDLEIASHKAILDFLILSLSHPSPSCVEDALETLAAISYLLVLGWEGENGRNGGLNADSSRALVLKISNLLNDG